MLCFASRLKHAKHYIGFSHIDVQTRLEEHLQGKGARLTRAVVAMGIQLRLAKTWDGVTRRFESYLKNQGSAVRWCPLCRAEGEPQSRNKTTPELARVRSCG